jgi:hypothetical protein
MSNPTPRSVGKLTVSHPAYNPGNKKFAVVMTFHSDTRIGDDEMRSAQIQASKEFAKVLIANGFQVGSDPEIQIEVDKAGRKALFTITCYTVRKLHA